MRNKKVMFEDFVEFFHPLNCYQPNQEAWDFISPASWCWQSKEIYGTLLPCQSSVQKSNHSLSDSWYFHRRWCFSHCATGCKYLVHVCPFPPVRNSARTPLCRLPPSRSRLALAQSAFWASLGLASWLRLLSWGDPKSPRPGWCCGRPVGADDCDGQELQDSGNTWSRKSSKITENPTLRKVLLDSFTC